MGRRRTDKKIDWEKVKALVGESPFTNKQISILFNRNHDWFSSCIRRNVCLQEDDAEKLALMLKVDSSEFILGDVNEDKAEDNTLTNLIAIVGRLECKVNKMNELLASLSEGAKKPIKNTTVPRGKRAQAILKKLCDEHYGRCKRSEYLKLLMQDDIPSSYADDAMKALGYIKMTSGYGNNTTTWIVNEVWEMEGE